MVVWHSLTTLQHLPHEHAPGTLPLMARRAACCFLLIPSLSLGHFGGHAVRGNVCSLVERVLLVVCGVVLKRKPACVHTRHYFARA